MEEEDGEDFTSMAMDSSSPTDLPFIKANLTLSKFFNVSVPIEDKFNFRWHLDKNNLTEQVTSNRSIGAKLSKFSGEPTGSAAPHPPLHQLCPLPLQPRLCNVLGENTIFLTRFPFFTPSSDHLHNILQLSVGWSPCYETCKQISPPFCKGWLCQGRVMLIS